MNTFTKTAVSCAVLTVAFAPVAAHALNTGYQLTPAKPFNTTGTAVVNTTTLTFPRFNPTAVPSTHLNPVLKGYRYFFPSVTFGGTLRIACDSADCPPNTLPSQQLATTISFANIIPGSTDVSKQLSATVNGPIDNNLVFRNISGTDTNFITPDVLFATGQLPNFTQPPNTNVSSSFYSTAWSYAGNPNVVMGSFNNATASGSIAVEYIYEYVPGPLPMLGVGAAFSWSRRMRRRFNTTSALPKT